MTKTALRRAPAALLIALAIAGSTTPSFASDPQESMLDEAALDAEQEEAVANLAFYLDSDRKSPTEPSGGRVGGVKSLLRQYFLLSEGEAEGLLLTSAGASEALSRGLARAPEQVRAAVLRDAVEVVQEAYPSARQNPFLHAVHPRSPWRIHTKGGAAPDPAGAPATQRTPPIPGVWQPKGGQTWPRASVVSPVNPDVRRPAVPAAAAGDPAGMGYSQLVARDRALPARRSFDTMIGDSRVWGGIVFGSPVTDDLPRVVSVSWETPEQGTSLGMLSFALEDGSVLDCAPVAREDLHAALAIVVGDEPRIAPLHPGEGVALAGITDAIDWFGVHEGEIEDRGRRLGIALHPAIENTDLGWSALSVDLLPLLGDQLLALIETNGTPYERELVAEMLAYAPDTWKVTDVPLHLSLEGERLVVERTEDSAPYFDPSLRREVWIGIRGAVLDAYGGTDSEVPEFDERFYACVPALKRASYDFERLNAFARVFALMRWAAADGARLTWQPKSVEPMTTPGSVVITAGGIVSAPAFDSHRALRELELRIDAELRAILRVAPQPARGVLALQLERLAKIDAAFDELSPTMDELSGVRGRLEALVGSSETDLARHAALLSAVETAMIAYWETPGGSPEEEAADAALRQAETALVAYYGGFEGAVGLFERGRDLDAESDDLRFEIQLLEEEVYDLGATMRAVMSAGPQGPRERFELIDGRLAEIGLDLGIEAPTLREYLLYAEENVAPEDFTEATPEVQARFVELYTARRHAQQLYERAPVGSAEEATALEDLLAARVELSQLYREEFDHVGELYEAQDLLEEAHALVAGFFGDFHRWWRFLSARRDLRA